MVPGSDKLTLPLVLVFVPGVGFASLFNESVLFSPLGPLAVVTMASKVVATYVLGPHVQTPLQLILCLS
jgi:hypothetical protein